MRVLASFAAIALSTMSAWAGGASVSGNWSGEMRQVDPTRETSYAMTLTITGAKGKSSYPSLNCSGTWARIGETKEGYAIFKETVLNEAEASCIDGLAIVRIDAGKLVLGWFASFEGTPSLASAVLAREEK
ncbi:MAG: hypothetical protein ABL996_12585 [Micropepsaceae bacterium]